MLKFKRQRNLNSRTTPELIFAIFNYTLLALIGFVTIYPMWHVICASVSDPKQMMAHNGLLFLPKGLSFSAFKQMFEYPLLFKSFLNTLIIVVVGSSYSLVLTAICAYILSVKNVYWNKLLGFMVTITMFIGGGMVPQYLLVSNTLHLNNSIWALILPAGINVYNMIILRTSFSSIPDSIREAAELDGASHFKTLFKIVLPLSKATLAVILLYYAVSEWNAWFNASIYLTDRKKYPLQLILREILLENNTDIVSSNSSQDQTVGVGAIIKYATIVFSTVPILCVYPFLQKHFTKGVMIGAVKG